MTTKNEDKTLPEPHRIHGFVWDANNVRLLAYALQTEYQEVGMWPENGIDVSDEVSPNPDSHRKEKLLVWGMTGCLHGLKYLHHHMRNLLNRPNQRGNY